MIVETIYFLKPFEYFIVSWCKCECASQAPRCLRFMDPRESVRQSTDGYAFLCGSDYFVSETCLGPCDYLLPVWGLS